ncbi:MAG: aminoacyl-tRNA hydrolase, partial [Candidatus Saccharimonadales bacterium]
GRSARAIIDFYKLDTVTDFLAIHDDLALPLGTLRVREKGSDAGNNGVKSLNAHLTEHYHRLRIGVWSELRNQVDDVAFVLGRFSKEEQMQLNQVVIPKAMEFIDEFVANTHQITSFTA